MLHRELYHRGGVTCLTRVASTWLCGSSKGGGRVVTAALFGGGGVQHGGAGGGGRFFGHSRVVHQSSGGGGTGYRLEYSDYGNPEKVISLERFSIPEPSASQVLVKMLVAPMNPADINMIEGSYPIKPSSFPAVGGNEGVGIVMETGDEVSVLKPGDWVIPRHAGWGTWRTHAVCVADELQKIPSDIPAEYAATMSVNPCTALRMLLDFTVMKPGDVIVQNGSTSGVGQAVVQIAAWRGIKSINIVRDREDFEDVAGFLKNLGNVNTHVVQESLVRNKAEVQGLIAQLGGKPRLALNCVGGKSATEMARLLEHGGTMVTYGGMSRKPVTIPTSLFIFKDIQLRGFWLSRWVEEKSRMERDKMFSELSGMIRDGAFKTVVEKFPMKDFQEALEYHRKPMKTLNKKAVLVLTE